jgi:MurNAc alpha-1-phosphate uridylyltransferase
MILAAGRGERMGALTADCPKALLQVGGRYLIDYAILNFKRAGIHEIVINVSYRGEQIQQALQSGEKYGVQLVYSEEPERLETGGGIFQALPLLGKEPFIVVSADVVTDFQIQAHRPIGEALAHLVMVDNPPYHPKGDFGLREHHIHLQGQPTYTFANIGWYHPDLFKEEEPGYFRLTKVLIPAITAGRVTGELYRGFWFNIGTPEDLEAFNQHK